MKIRLSPSGPVIGDAGAGFRLQLKETQYAMGGTQAIPADPATLSSLGMGSAPNTLTILKPSKTHRYRAELELDVTNSSTNVGGQVVLYLDYSIDGGTSFTNRVANVHLVHSTSGASDVEARQIAVHMPLTTGEELGVTDDTPSLILRARANLPVGTAGSVLVNSLATSGGGTPVAGLNGTIHMELEECLGLP
jgi:hypothetical protein